MFSGFPILSAHLLKTLYRQGFRYFVEQPFPGVSARSGKLMILISPFFARDKAEYYLMRLGKVSKQLYDLNDTVETNTLLQKSAQHATAYVKILTSRFQLDKYTRNLLAEYLRAREPAFFAKMAANNFRIVIGDNFGKIFYKVRIGQGTELPVNDEDLRNLHMHSAIEAAETPGTSGTSGTF
jgi:hypothetical protein